MEKDRTVFEVKKTIKRTIFLGISIIIHLKDFVYHKRLFSIQCQNGGFKTGYGIHTTVPTHLVILNEFPICNANGHLRQKKIKYVDGLPWKPYAPRQTLWLHQRLTSSQHNARQSRIRLDGILMIHGYRYKEKRLEN